MKYGFRKNFIVLAIILFLLSAIAFWFLYREIQKNNASSEKTLTEWQIEDSRRNEIKTIMRSVASIQQNNEIIGTHFANSSNLVPFLDTIDSFAPKVGAEDEITSVDILPDTKELIVGIKVLGSFESIYQFLTLLENSPYEIEFLAVDVQKASKDEGYKSEKTSKLFPWEGMFKIKLVTFVP
ncbi:MAG TPA: hypothetical protein PLO44_01380 [Candidatus Paceibacterota bacterium]|nr:hypothetical protein [Candidatus Paceibacterota bacterium]